MTQSQKEFEAKFPMPNNCARCGDGYAPTSYSAWEAQEYVTLWKGWQASRQALVIELPPLMKGIDEQCRINNKAVSMLKDLLDNSGVRYK